MSKHVEFPELTPEARRAFYAAEEAWQAFVPDDRPRVGLEPRWFRRCLATFLREAIKQALDKPTGLEEVWDELKAIADNLHSPPPLPPTLAQARAADLNTPEGRRVVYTFLASLGQGGQP
jgi:hypothetical protein